MLQVVASFPISASQGSVATRLRCGEIVNVDFIANLPANLSIKGFGKLVNMA